MKVENREVSGTADPFKGSILEGIFAIEFKLLVEGVKIPETIQEAESLDKSAIKVALAKCVTGQYDKARNAKIKEIVEEMEKTPEKHLNGEKLNQFREVLKSINKKK